MPLQSIPTLGLKNKKAILEFKRKAILLFTNHTLLFFLLQIPNKWKNFLNVILCKKPICHKLLYSVEQIHISRAWPIVKIIL